MDFLEVSLPSNRFWSNSDANIRQIWDFARTNEVRGLRGEHRQLCYRCAARQIKSFDASNAMSIQGFEQIFGIFEFDFDLQNWIFQFEIFLKIFVFVSLFWRIFFGTFCSKLKRLKYWNLPQNLWTFMCSGWRGLFAEKLEASARSRVSQYLSSVERGSRDYDMEKMTCTLWNSERLFSKAEILFLAVKWGAEPENQIKFFYENAIQFWQNPNHEFFTQNIFDNFSREMKVVSS